MTDIHALVGAYALDAVDDLERAAFDRHLTDCENCRTEVDELRETAARLANSTWSAPPPRLRTDVMAAIGRTRQLSPAAPAVNSPDERSSRRRRWSVAVAAAVVLAGGGAAVCAVQEQRVREADALVAAAEQREARTRAILAAPDLVVRTAPVVGGGKVTVASSQLRDAGVVLLAADRAPAANQAFQLWTISGKSSPANAGVLDPGASSDVRVLDGLSGTDVFAVSLEPAGGSATPSTLVAEVRLTT
jgi:anti-sigma-K factor RskA